MNRALIPLAFIILLLGSTLTTVAQTYSPPHGKPGPAADKITFRSYSLDIAGPSLLAGDMDLYLFPLRVTTVRELVSRGGSSLLQAPASTVSIILNPAPAPRGQLNPFSIRDVRYAVQYLVNREFVTGEVYRGLAAPMIAQVSPFEYDYLSVVDLVQGFNFRHDPDFAKQLINNAMTKTGAVLREGKWWFNNQPILLKFIVRVEDERREIGDALAAQLENMGFNVARSYQQFGPAIQKVYTTDPQVFEWHLYTEGFGKGAAERFDYLGVNQMLAPWFGNMPGWQETGFWQYENKTLDELGQKLFRGEFNDEGERSRLHRDMTELGIQESVRVFVATVLNTFPASERLKGLTLDSASGPRSIWTLRDAYVEGKSEIRVGNLWVWTERTVWNPIGGFGDVYSADIWRNVFDPFITRDPFRGTPIPFRGTYEVETRGPRSKLPVPGDAAMWDSKADRWVPVGRGVEATSKVTYNFDRFLSSRWHHGQRITMADIIYPIAQIFDIVYDADKSKIEFSISAVTKPYLSGFKGFRIVGNSLEVYVDFWHFIPDYIAEFGELTSRGLPWEILKAMDDLVFVKRQAAYSDTASEKFQVPWVSLTAEKDSRLIRNVIRELLEKSEFPRGVFDMGGQSLADSAEARRRYGAVLKWFDDRGILVISNGPFILVRFDPPAQYAELTAFRDPDYPLKPGDIFRGVADPLRLTKVEAAPLQRGSEWKVSIRAEGPGDLALNYLVIDPSTGTVISKGAASSKGQGEFDLTLPGSQTAGMTARTYQLILAASSSELSAVTQRVISVESSGGVLVTTTPTPTTTLTTTVQPPTTPATTETPTQPTTVQPTTIKEPQQTPAAGFDINLIAIGVVVIVALAGGLIAVMRRRGRSQ
jgi:peptide/nickel transport system substrate-binding protein